MESLVIFSTLPLNTWSFSRKVYVRRLLVETTAIIFPVMSRTVPCRTSSGMARQRFPLAQLCPGPTDETLRIGLTKGSRRPAAPIRRAGTGFFSSFGGGSTRATLGCLTAPGLAAAAGTVCFAVTPGFAGAAVGVLAAAVVDFAVAGLATVTAGLDGALEVLALTTGLA